MNSKVDNYFMGGCGRCPLGGTPNCKVHSWQKELAQLRRILLDCGLTEDLKWAVPCYTFQKRNIVLMSAFVDYCALSFFKGALLPDAHGVLDRPGENTQSARLIRFTHVQGIMDMELILKVFIHEAIEVEKAGLKVAYQQISEFAVPEEFQRKLDENLDLKNAFEALTPGRQRGYLLYFSAPKQSKTRAIRVEKHIPQILDGKGFHDR